MTSWFGFGGGKKQPPKGNAPKGKSPEKGQPPKNQPKKQPQKEPQKVGKTGAKDQPKGGQQAAAAAAAKGAPIRRTKSTDSSFLMKGVNTKEHFGSRLSSVNGSPTGESMFDVCAYVILCPKHSKILVSREEKSKYVWLPFVYLPTQRTWNDGAINGANIILANGDAQAFVALQSKPAIAEATAMQMFRLQLPQTQKFNIRLIYFVKLSDKSDFKCCADTSRLKWMNAQDVQRGKIDNLWGPEIADFSQKISAAIVHTINEYSLDEALTYVPRDPPRNLEEEMLKSTNYTEKDVERLYSDFVEHCFPSFFMTQTSFNDYMSKYGFEKADKKLELLFRAFNFHKNSFLGFHEFLLGLTSIDPMANNGQSRIKFIFKYFDVDSDGYLNEKEFTTMVREIYPKDSNSVIKQKATESMKMIGTKGSKGVFFEDFFRAVGAHKFRGTHSLCRSNRPILAQISRSMASRTLKRSSDKKLKLESILKDRKYKGICQSCREKKYEYAKHTVRINAEGWCDQPKKLPEYEQLKKTKGSDESVDKEAKDANKESPDKESKSERKSLRKGSKDDSNNSTDSKKESAGGSKKESASTDVVWNHKSVANYFVEAIRAFNLKKGSHKDNKGLFDGSAEKEDFVKKLEYLCSAVEKLAMNEPRCVPMSSPAFIVGDIHGNLEDLLTLEKVLWRSAPIMAANFVFLGDYVDRGKWGLECSIYLMCLKLLAPHKVVMLRGNHEVRDLQKHYTYRKECCGKYGDALGDKVFEMTNRVFDRLPFCAVIDEAIFCSHGGIPCSARLIDKINEVKNDLRDPENQSAIAWEILWSDPIGPQQFAETAELLQARVESAKGFLTNTKRGTAFLYGEEAVNTFLQTNSLTHIVRAHEVPAHGFTFHFGSKCTTIFSCSHYCGNNNEAACVHVDNEKLRIVRLDTVNNAPASD